MIFDESWVPPGSTRDVDDMREDDERTVVVEAQRGDLLIFDNVNTEHAVDELNPTDEGEALASRGEVIRQIVG